jgi:hypothetical protein
MHKGHVGVMCGDCNATANIPAQVGIWTCPICNFNNLVIEIYPVFENPRLGPSLSDAAYEYMEDANGEPSDSGLAADPAD